MPRDETPRGTIRAALAAFNTADCARLDALTAPWKRPPPATLPACRRSFSEAHREGVTVLRLVRAGQGHYLSPGDRAYRQPLLLLRTIYGHAIRTHETMQLVEVGERWYVQAMW